MSFIHLHVHSEYSLLDGLSHPGRIVQRAKELGQPAVALTDHGVMHGVVDFYVAARQAGVKPIVGMEAYLARRTRQDRDPQKDKSPHHLLLLAQDNAGYQNLLQLASLSQLEGFYYRPRVDKEILERFARGLIVTTGCGSAEIPRLIQDGQIDQARQAMAWHVDVFGRERFFVELQLHEGIPHLIDLNRQLLALGKEFGLQPAATNDAHYLRAEDARAQDILLCIGTGSLVSEPKRMKMSDASYYLKSSEEMAALFGELPEALSNTLRIAEMCSVDLDPKGYHLPEFPVPGGYTPEIYLRRLCEDGLAQRYGSRASDPEVRQRLDYELGVIHQMGFDTYFLIVSDLTRYAREHGIWWNVRGSAAGSIVAYTTGITILDPLPHGLIFERFLNPGRISMPDIDLDFPDDRRGEMIEYAVRKYGRDKVAQIITFGTLGARAAIRDVGRALDVPLGEVDRLAKLVPAIPGKPITIREAIEQVPELKQAYESTPYLRTLLDTAVEVEGTARSVGTHAAGVIISDRPLIEYVPLHRPTKSGGDSSLEAITQFEMGVCESLGLLKIDFLGLSTLTVMRKACELIEQRHGVQWTLDTIPTDDPAAFALMARGDVIGLFQVEGEGLRRVLTDMKPTRFEHIVAAISLFRPGPMEYIPTYIRRMHGKEPIEYKHPQLEPILAETYGICVSGDAIVTDARTGRRYHLDKVHNVPDLTIQGVNENWQPAVGRITRWIDNGYKPVYRVALRNGAHIKVTADHRLLTEEGWRPLRDLRRGDYIATPPCLFGPDSTEALAIDRRRLRVLAYLIADGSLSSMAAADFVSKDPALLAEYERCLENFENVRLTFVAQVRGVTRISVAKDTERVAHYHAPNELLAWLRELGLKSAPGSQPGGVRSHEKFVPDFIFELSQSDIAFFLASLWDCDGYMGRKLCHYKTVSRRLADDVQTLLLRLGIRSTSYTASYPIQGRDGEPAPIRHSYQVTTFDTQRLAEWLQPHMVTRKGRMTCASHGTISISRSLFIDEVDAVSSLPYRALMVRYGIDRQHFYPNGRRRDRISAQVVAPLAQALALPETGRRLNVVWEEIVSIEPAGKEHVYDLTVEGLQSFVANNIVVHNCVYQEQIIQIAVQLAGYAPGEADDIRKAVGKKIREKIDAHRAKFVKGAVANGIDRATAEAIYGDIEFFARYGFNRAHAADYAMLTCQTAYLKAHHPVEYMTALLTVERNNTAKVGLLIVEARRLGVDVLPPDVTRSQVDFTIERSGAREAIRFGLGAVKNVGEGPVRAIIDARAAGSFHSLDDFCSRVDLRQVNRRALEALIKVGAFEAFGNRAQLLASVDRMLGSSGAAHRARDAGQMSLFGQMDADATALALGALPSVGDAPLRERLEWEKELIGVYISEHPVARALAQSRDVVSHLCGEIGEEHHDQKVTVLGRVAAFRKTTTKKGEPMAFVTLEDVQSAIDVVVFPKVWQQTQSLWQRDKIVVVRGRVDARGRKPSIICDSVSDSLAVAQPADPLTPNSGGVYTPPSPRPASRVGEPAVAYKADPAPAARPPESPISTESAANHHSMQPVEPAVALSPALETAVRPGTPQPHSSSGERAASNGDRVTLSDRPRHLRVTIQRSGDDRADARRVGDAHRLLRSFSGPDRFTFYVTGGGNGSYELDFPNDTTLVCDELLARLSSLLGEQAVSLVGGPHSDL